MPQIPDPSRPQRRPNPYRTGTGGAPERRPGSAPARRAPGNPPPRQRPERGPADPGGNRPRRRQKPERKKPENLKMKLLIGAMILGSLIMLGLCIGIAGSSSRPAPQKQPDSVVLPEGGQEAQTEETKKKDPLFGKPEETEAPAAAGPQVVSSAKVSCTGDLLIHRSLFNESSAAYKGDKKYDFDSVFKYLDGYTDLADFAVANLETTLFGPGKPYSGNPKFNTPDELVDSAKKAGFDMLLTANNHCNDTDLDGILRTLKVVREKGLQTLGTNLNLEEEKYVIQEINGINIGMLCYTYEDSRNPNLETFNYNELAAKGKGLVCAFPKFQDAKSRDPFYETLTAQIAEMKDKGAEAIVLFVHWGEEYHLEADADQKAMAQKFCDLGVDLIVGGHPHVVQPVELLTSTTDPSHKTVCLYSMGNAVSNQRREEMSSCTTGHTEDGMLFNFTFDKYSDGQVLLSSVEVVPTWVNMFTNGDEKREYNILPLEDSRREDWQSMFGLAPGTIAQLDASYQRTMGIVGSGLQACNDYLTEQKAQLEAGT